MSSASITSPATAIPSGPTASLDDDDEGARARVLVVLSAGRAFGIPVSQVREVFRAQRITRVPGAPPVVRGIVNVRGAVVTVLELSVLQRAERAVPSTSVVLLEHGSGLVGLAVDAVRDVRAEQALAGDDDAAGGDAAYIMPLDAVALCAPHLLSSEEMGR